MLRILLAGSVLLVAASAVQRTFLGASAVSPLDLFHLAGSTGTAGAGICASASSVLVDQILTLSVCAYAIAGVISALSRTGLGYSRAYALSTLVLALTLASAHARHSSLTISAFLSPPSAASIASLPPSVTASLAIALVAFLAYVFGSTASSAAQSTSIVLALSALLMLLDAFLLATVPNGVAVRFFPDVAGTCKKSIAASLGMLTPVLAASALSILVASAAAKKHAAFACFAMASVHSAALYALVYGRPNAAAAEAAKDVVTIYVGAAAALAFFSFLLLVLPSSTSNKKNKEKNE
eukprot:ANDGO_07575.mRNA.1 hypothetical protein